MYLRFSQYLQRPLQYLPKHIDTVACQTETMFLPNICLEYNGPTNALVCIKTLIQMSQTKTFQITPTCFDHQMIIISRYASPHNTTCKTNDRMLPHNHN
jgi:hypothetical protein